MSEQDKDNISEEQTSVDFVLLDEQPDKEVQIEVQDPTPTAPHIRRLKVLVLGLVLISALLYLYWPRYDSSFPNIAAGTYLGTITGLSKNFTNSLIYIERNGLGGTLSKRSLGDQIFLALLESEQTPLVIPIFTPHSNALLEESVTVKVDGLDFKLVGRKISNSNSNGNRYQGRVLNIDRKPLGIFSIEQITPGVDLKLSDQLRSQLKAYLTLKRESIEVSEQLRHTEYLIPKQEQEIERLKRYLQDGVSLRERSRDKLDQSRAELIAAQELFKTKQAKAQALAAQLEVSQKVTAAGKLVSLARDSIERENRWIDAKFRDNGLSPSIRPGEEFDLDRSREQELQNQIEIIKTRLTEIFEARPEIKHEFSKGAG